MKYICITILTLTMCFKLLAFEVVLLNTYGLNRILIVPFPIT